MPRPQVKGSLKERVDQGGTAWEVMEMGLNMLHLGGSLTLKAVGKLLLGYGNLDTICRTDAVTWRMALNGDSPTIWECARKERVHFQMLP